MLELRPRVLQHGADLHLGAHAARWPSNSGCAARTGSRRDLQVPAGVAEPTFAGGLSAHVAVLEHGELVGEQVGHGGDVAEHVGDHADADLVGDLGQRVGVDGDVPPRVRSAFAANDATLLARPVTVR